MLNFFDYIFYSVFKGYQKNGDEIPGVYALAILTLIQFLILISFLAIPLKLLEYEISIFFTRTNILISIISLLVINALIYFKFKKPIEVFEFWETQPYSRKRKMKLGMYLTIIILIVGFVLAVTL